MAQRAQGGRGGCWLQWVASAGAELAGAGNVGEIEQTSGWWRLEDVEGGRLEGGEAV